MFKFRFMYKSSSNSKFPAAKIQSFAILLYPSQQKYVPSQSKYDGGDVLNSFAGGGNILTVKVL